MATQLTDEELFSVLDADHTFETKAEAGRSLGLSRKGFAYRLEVARDRLGDLPDYGEPIEGFSSPELPTDELPTDELIEHMKRRYSTRKNAKDARDPIPIKMKSNDPVGLLMFGDIHVDSPQCNWPELDRCVAICESTEGMRGVSLGGDHTDNWIGRLQAEYAKSEASAKQRFQLAEWFIKKIKPLIIIRGNHDAWSGQGDPLEYIHTAGSMYEQWKALVELQWPNGRKAVLDVAHDHVGTS